jgi:hypothetical protein
MPFCNSCLLACLLCLKVHAWCLQSSSGHSEANSLVVNTCHVHINKHVPPNQIYTHQLISRQACQLSSLFAAAEHSLSCSVDEDIRSEMSATISSLSWSAAAGILSAGTSTGRVAFWKHEQSMALSSSSSAHHMDADPSVHWLPQRGMTVAGRVDNVVWGRDDR